MKILAGILFVILLTIAFEASNLKVRLGSVAMLSGTIVFILELYIKKRKGIKNVKYPLHVGSLFFITGCLGLYLQRHPFFIQVLSKNIFFPLSLALIGFGTLFIFQAIKRRIR